MSKHSTDDEAEGWTDLLNEKETDTSRSSSSEFVQVENNNTVSFHLNQSLQDVPDIEHEAVMTSSTVSDEGLMVPQHCSEVLEPLISLNLQEEDKSNSNDESVQNIESSSLPQLNLSENSFENVQDLETSAEILKSVETLSAEETQSAGPTDYPVEVKYAADSDSDHSDFVRLESGYVDEEEEERDAILSNMVASTSSSGGNDDVMKLSDTTSSSLSSSFRFIHRSHMVLGAEQYLRRRLYRDDDDAESVQSDVDDRCESDISGIADEDELSSAGLGDLPIAAGNVVRSYKHRPNSDLNRTLTTLALIVLFAAVGIAVGHYIGTRTPSWRRQQEQKISSLSDDYLMCLNRQEHLEEQTQACQKDMGEMQELKEELHVKEEELMKTVEELEQTKKKKVPTATLR